MKVEARSIKTPIGYYLSPLNPSFVKELEECQTNEDLFKLVDVNGFINPDAFNEVNARNLYGDYCRWKKGE